MSTDLLSDPDVRRTVRGILNTDPLGEVERATGKSYRDPSNALLGLAYGMATNERKAQIMRSLDDTHYGLPFAETLRIACELGFREAHSETFAGNYGTDRFLILWRPDGYLLVLESFTWEGREAPATNAARLYFNLSNGRQVFFRMGCSGGLARSSADTYVGNKDVREGLRFTLAELEAAGCAPVSPWVERPHLWLRTYAEKDSATPPDARLERLPGEVLAMIGGAA